MMNIAFLLFLVAGTLTVQGEELPGLSENGPKPNLAVSRAKRWSGISFFDRLRGKGDSSVTKPTTPPAKAPSPSAGSGFNLADALKPGVRPSKPSAGNDSGFLLEHALNPAEKPSGEDDQAAVLQKLNMVIQNQKQELGLLLQLLANHSG
ncbi:uncharacterized protein V3H82_024016 [Fundulus diaphanus]